MVWMRADRAGIQPPQLGCTVNLHNDGTELDCVHYMMSAIDAKIEADKELRDTIQNDLDWVCSFHKRVLMGVNVLEVFFQQKPLRDPLALSEKVKFKEMYER